MLITIRSKLPTGSTILTFAFQLFLIIQISLKCGHCADPGYVYCYEDLSCGPSTWGGDCQTGKQQSPVNLETSKVKRVPKSVNLVLSRQYAQAQPFSLLNTGASVSLAVSSDTTQIQVKGNGFLPNEPWFFNSLHFHWGPHNLVGSEHTINGQQFPIEMHMIHQQLSEQSKLAVFGVLYQVGDYDNPALSPIVDNLNLVRNPSDSVSLYGINLTALIPKKVKVFRYQGSKTTPPCAEGVAWTVFADIQTISNRQMGEFRKLLGVNGRPITRNYRPIQPTFTDQRKTVYLMKSIVPNSGAVKKKG